MKTRWFAPLTVLALAVIAIAIASWYMFPAWRETEGGFLQLLAIVVVSIVPIAKEVLIFIKEWNAISKPAKNEETSSPVVTKSPEFSLVSTRPNLSSGKAVLRSLLLDALREQELREIVSDYFPELSLSVSAKSSAREIVAELIDFVFARRQIEDLIGFVKTYNPRQYQHYEQRVKEVIATLDNERS